MNVFVSYGSVADQVTALRLQALGAVNGLTLYVPPAYTRGGALRANGKLDAEAAENLRGADIVFGIVSAGISDACREELNTSRKLSKPSIVMADPQDAAQLELQIRGNLVVIDPANPDQTELAIVQHLKSLDAGERATNALIALGTLALGLLILAPQA